MQPALHPATRSIVIDTPVLMLPALARLIGMDEAMLLQQIHYWLSLGGHEHDGRRWIYNTYHAWTEQFPGWSKDKVRRIVERLRGRGLAGVTVLRGIEGFGARQHLHTSRLLSLSEDLPILIESVDTEEKIRQVLPEMDEMVGDGLITLERVEVVAYRARPRRSE